tara:strand:- start:110 stop:268 length:159 start_codon:yes stop_codon:yes gene_type:complete
LPNKDPLSYGVASMHPKDTTNPKSQTKPIEAMSTSFSESLEVTNKWNKLSSS